MRSVGTFLVFLGCVRFIPFCRCGGFAFQCGCIHMHLRGQQVRRGQSGPFCSFPCSRGGFAGGGGGGGIESIYCPFTCAKEIVRFLPACPRFLLHSRKSGFVPFPVRFGCVRNIYVRPKGRLCCSGRYGPLHSRTP